MNVSWLTQTPINSWTNTGASIDRKDVSQQSRNPQIYYMDKGEIFLVMSSVLNGMDSSEQQTRKPRRGISIISFISKF